MIDLQKLKVADLKKIAESLGIPVKGNKKDPIIDCIKSSSVLPAAIDAEAQKYAPTTQSGSKARGPPTPSPATGAGSLANLSSRVDEMLGLIKAQDDRIRVIDARITAIEQRHGNSPPSLQSRANIGNLSQFRDILRRALDQLKHGLQVQGNYPLKDVLALLQRSHDINPNAFEDYILQLYRKQEIDLQPGGDPAEYHLHSPTRKEFYYLIPHNAPAESGSAKKD